MTRREGRERGGLLGMVGWIVAVCWIAFAAYLGWSSAPHIPMDISASDPATRQAYTAAWTWHVIRHAALALVPAGLVVGIARMLTRPR